MILSWLIVLSLKCLFSRFRKYLVFFSPSLYHLILHLKIAPWVRSLIISSNSLLDSSSCSVLFVFYVSLTEGSSSSFSSKAIFSSSSCCLCEVLRFLAVAKLRDFSRILSLVISQRSAGFIDLSFAYSFSVSWIVNLIKSI